MMTYREIRTFRAVASVLLMGLAGRAAAQSSWYVARSGTGDGSSWASPTNSLQGAIDACTVGGTVWVGAGVYDTGGVKNFPAGSTLTNRVAIHKAITVSSTNANPALTVIQGAWHPVTTNGPAAVRGVYLAAGAKLIGFTVTNGATHAFGNTTQNCSGGGIYAYDTTAIVSNCVVAGNVATGSGSTFGGGGGYLGSFLDCTIAGNVAYHGGGTYNSVVSNCTVRANTARQTPGSSTYPRGGGMFGGAVYTSTLSENLASENGGGAIFSMLYSCLVSNNAAGSLGGGIENCSVVQNCRILNNRGSTGGGANAASLYNCLVAGNYAASSKGGGAANSKLWNCTVVTNRAQFAYNVGAGLYTCSVITNCIVQCNVQGSAGAINNYDNSTCPASAFGATCTTPAKAGWAAGNITDNPSFVDTAAGDYRLAKGSPCIDTGTNLGWMGVPTDARSRDLDGNPRVLNDTVDMGAYEVESFSVGTVILLR